MTVTLVGGGVGVDVGFAVGEVVGTPVGVEVGFSVGEGFGVADAVGVDCDGVGVGNDDPDE